MAALSLIGGGAVTSSSTSRAPRGWAFGHTYVKWPTGIHQATVVWLHGLNDTGYNCSEIMGHWCGHAVNIKWLFPTAPTRPVSLLGGMPGTAWFNPHDVTEANEFFGYTDFEGLNATAEHIAQILAMEPTDVKVVIGGFSIGGAAALYAATHFVLGDGITTIRTLGNLRAVVVLSGWLPSYRSLETKLERARFNTVDGLRTLQFYVAHGDGDDVVRLEHGGLRVVNTLHENGFPTYSWSSIPGLGHGMSTSEIQEMCNWLIGILQLRGY